MGLRIKSHPLVHMPHAPHAIKCAVCFWCMLSYTLKISVLGTYLRASLDTPGTTPTTTMWHFECVACVQQVSFLQSPWRQYRHTFNYLFLSLWLISLSVKLDKNTNLLSPFICLACKQLGKNCLVLCAVSITIAPWSCLAPLNNNCNMNNNNVWLNLTVGDVGSYNPLGTTHTRKHILHLSELFLHKYFTVEDKKHRRFE